MLQWKTFSELLMLQYALDDFQMLNKKSISWIFDDRKNEGRTSVSSNGVARACSATADCTSDRVKGFADT